MADDYDVDLSGLLDMDDGWLYVEDDYDLADELAEGQLANPGYSGTNYEIDMDCYEFELFAYWDDLEYVDDAYWDYGSRGGGGGGHGSVRKRKRSPSATNIRAKKLKTTVDRVLALNSGARDVEPLLFRSREERNKMLKKEAPRVAHQASFAFMADWKERFANANGISQTQQMPADMKRAAEGQHEDADFQTKHDAEDDTWSDDAEDAADDAHGEGGVHIDPEILRAILKDKLKAAGLEDMGEEAFMQTIRQMICGVGDGAAGELTDTLLGKLTSGTGHESVSGWLSQQGVSLEDDDDQSSATVENAQEPLTSARQQTIQGEWSLGRGKTETPLHPSHPDYSKRARPPTSEDEGEKKRIRAKFDFSPSPPTVLSTHGQDDENNQIKEMDSETVLSTTKAVDSAVAELNRQVLQSGRASSNAHSGKRKATSEEPAEDKSKTKKTKIMGLQPCRPEAPPDISPTKRTRSAKGRSKK